MAMNTPARKTRKNIAPFISKNSINIKIKKELLAELQNSSLNPDPDPNLAAKQSIENKHSCAQTKKRLSKNVFRITDG